MRHVVRKIEPSRSTPLEERLWPVLLALLALGGFVLAGIHWLNPPREPRAWWPPDVPSQLTIGVTVVAMIVAALIRPCWIHRRFLLSLVLSLLFNLTFLAILSWMEVVHLFREPPAVAEQPEVEPPERTVPEYFPLAVEGKDRPEQELRKPVPSGDPQMTQDQLLSKSSLPMDRTRTPLPEPSAQVSSPQPPLPKNQPLRVESAPREFDLQGQISRQPLADRPRVARPLVDSTTVAQQPLRIEIAAPPAPVQRQVNSAAELPVDLESATSVRPRLAASPPRYRELDSPEVSLDSRPAMPDRTAVSGTPPRAVISVTDQPALARKIREESITAANTVSARRELVAPMRAPDEPAADQQPTVSPDPTSLARQQPSEAAPQIAESKEATPRRSETADATPSTVTRLAPPTVAAQVPQPTVTPPASSIPVPQMRQPMAVVELPGPAAERPSEEAIAEVRQPKFDRSRAVGSETGDRGPIAITIARRATSPPAPSVDGGRAVVAPPIEQRPAEAVTQPARVALAPRARPGSNLPPPTGGAPDVTAVAGPVPVLPLDEPRLERFSPVETSPSLTNRPGGGTRRPTEQPASTPQIHAPVTADVVAIPGRESSTGEVDASPWAEQDTRPAIAGLGLPGLQPRESLGAVAEDELTEGREGFRAAAVVGRPRVESMQEPALSIGQQFENATLDRSARVTRRPGGTVATVPVPTPLAGTLAPTTADLLPQEVAIAPQSGPVAESAAGALEVALDAPEDLGGLDRDRTPDIGTMNRRSQPESAYVVDRGVRFLRRDLGGPPSLDTRVAMPADAFLSRFNRRGEEPAGGDGRPLPKTEEAIERGLVYLSRLQRVDGRWSLEHADLSETDPSDEPVAMRSDTAATGLVLLSFLGAGYHHYDDKHRDLVRMGLQFLIDHQQPNGDLYLPQDPLSDQSAWLYSHGIAAIALCEAYGMTQDPQLREPAQKAVDFIVAAQHPTRGGWRYVPGVGSDTSVSGWMVMALRSAELANLQVPTSVWEGVERWLQTAQASPSQNERYRYNPFAPNTPTQAHGREPSDTMTAVGLLMRMYTGWRRNNPAMIRGADYLLLRLPEIGSETDPRRDTYYWYYATQVMFHMRGEYWDRWQGQLHPMLVASQEQDGAMAGSWDPDLPVVDRWAPYGGRLYVTTLNLLSLEVYYRHLPIYEDTAR